MDAKKYLILFLIAVLFNFYFWYFKMYLVARRRLQPWMDALKRMRV